MLETGAHYLRVVGPLYGFFGVGLVLYFASQGAGRLLWPVLGNIARLAVAGTGGWLALRWGGGLTGVFAAQGVALVVYGIVIASAIAGRRLVRPRGLAAHPPAACCGAWRRPESELFNDFHQRKTHHENQGLRGLHHRRQSRPRSRLCEGSAGSRRTQGLWRGARPQERHACPA